jgi:CelD/BcsL family acetyltransferase involved in cellulose biosynthesis
LNTSTEILDLGDPSWARFVESIPGATPLHHPAWAALIADCYRLRGFVVALRDATGELVAGAPFIEVGRRRRWVSLAFTDFCAPLGDSEAAGRLLLALEEQRLAKGIRSIEIRDRLGADTHKTRVGYRHQLALDAAPEEIRKRFNRSQVQRGIRQAERDGVRVRLAANRDDLDVFYSLHLATRRRLGVPIQPRAFFDGLWNRVIETGLGTIFVAELGGRAVAAAIFFGWRDMLIYKFGASDRTAWPQRPNHALFWSAIRWACDSNFSVLDFGRTDLDNEGLRTFKSNWGTVETELVYSTLGDPPAVRTNSKTRRALGAVIRHSPEFVCRELGERLYRYAA